MTPLQRRELALSERIALIALSGIALSVATWFAHAYVDGVLFGGRSFASAIIEPDTQATWSRLVLVLSILVGTALGQTVYAKRIQAEHVADLERARTRLAYDHSPDGIICLTPGRTVTYANTRVASLVGAPVSELTGRTCHAALFGAEVPCPGCRIAEVVETRSAREHTLEVTLRSGDTRWLERVQYPVLDARGAVESVVEIVRDVTALKLADQQISRALLDSQERHRLLVNHSPDVIIVAENGAVSFINPAGLELLGIEDSEPVLGRSVASLFVSDPAEVPPSEFELATIAGVFSRPIPTQLLRPDHNRVHVELTGSRLTVEGRQVVQYVARDITERLAAEQTIRTMAFYDPLTELPNRTLFFDRLRNAITHARRTGTTLAVAFLDLDSFKLINDTLNHAAGDEILCLIGQRLRETLREADTVARMGGDEFTVIAQLSSPDDAAILAERVLGCLDAPLVVGENVVRITGSLGIALYPAHGEDSADLVRNADIAMYEAKDVHLNSYRLFEPSMAERTVDRMRLETELRHALEHRAFGLVYQPQVDVRGGRIVGVEALLRWHHPERGPLAPAHFLEVAEQSDLITRIGRQVLRVACDQAAEWRAAGLDFGRIAVNLSARELRQSDIAEFVSETLEATGLPAHLLELEITESTTLQGIERVLDTLHALRELGVRIAIDDFGTGYSSLGYLKRFPVQTLKIAQTFMSDVHRDDHSRGIALTIINLCDVLGLDIIAEGVERNEQLDFLVANGCSVVQGYLFRPPLAADEIVPLFISGVEARHAHA